MREFSFSVKPDPEPQQMSYWQRLGIAIEIILAPVGGVLAWFAFIGIMERLK